jgi:hypothetical protein
LPVYILESTEQTNNKGRTSRQTHTQGNNKNNEGKQHRKNTNGRHTEGDSEPKKQRNRILQAYENKYPTHLKMAM